METKTKPRKSIKLWFKRTPNQSLVSVLPETAATCSGDYRDQQRTKERYLEALNLLKEAIRGYQGVWGSFEFDELTGEPEKFDDALFKTKINAALESRQNAIKDESTFNKAKQVIESIYTSLSPLAKNLMIARDAQSVYSLRRNQSKNLDKYPQSIWSTLRWLAFTHDCKPLFL